LPGIAEDCRRLPPTAERFRRRLHRCTASLRCLRQRREGRRVLGFPPYSPVARVRGSPGFPGFPAATSLLHRPASVVYADCCWCLCHLFSPQSSNPKRTLAAGPPYGLPPVRLSALRVGAIPPVPGYWPLEWCLRFYGAFPKKPHVIVARGICALSRPRCARKRQKRRGFFWNSGRRRFCRS